MNSPFNVSGMFGILTILAMHIADLLSKTIKGASFGTMSDPHLAVHELTP